MFDDSTVSRRVALGSSSSWLVGKQLARQQRLDACTCAWKRAYAVSVITFSQPCTYELTEVPGAGSDCVPRCSRGTEESEACREAEHGDLTFATGDLTLRDLRTHRHQSTSTTSQHMYHRQRTRALAEFHWKRPRTASFVALPLALPLPPPLRLPSSPPAPTQSLNESILHTSDTLGKHKPWSSRVPSSSWRWRRS